MNNARLTLLGVSTLLASAVAFAVSFSLNPPRPITPPFDRVLSGNLPIIASSINSYREANGALPTSLKDLQPSHEQEGYLKMLPNDPWGSSYVYRTDGSTFALYSIGANSIDDNTDGDDIVYGAAKDYRCDLYGAGCAPKISALVMAASPIMMLAGLGVTATGVLAEIYQRIRNR